MEKMTILQAAEKYGSEMARSIGNADLDSWSALDRNDNIPSEDYVTLRKIGEVTACVEKTYKTAFNRALAVRVAR
jgi:hypothetical protein